MPIFPSSWFGGKKTQPTVPAKLEGTSEITLTGNEGYDIQTQRAGVNEKGREYTIGDAGHSSVIVRGTPGNITNIKIRALPNQHITLNLHDAAKIKHIEVQGAAGDATIYIHGGSLNSDTFISIPETQANITITNSIKLNPTMLTALQKKVPNLILQ